MRWKIPVGESSIVVAGDVVVAGGVRQVHCPLDRSCLFEYDNEVTAREWNKKGE